MNAPQWLNLVLGFAVRCHLDSAITTVFNISDRLSVTSESQYVLSVWFGILDICDSHPTEDDTFTNPETHQQGIFLRDRSGLGDERNGYGRCWVK